MVSIATSVWNALVFFLRKISAASLDGCPPLMQLEKSMCSAAQTVTLLTVGVLAAMEWLTGSLHTFRFGPRLTLIQFPLPSSHA
jgi:hypothetical protein